MTDQIAVSESVDMYLVTMARIKEDGSNGAIPLSELAGRMEILPVSVNEMVRKLQDAGLVEYTPYKGVDFTPEGQYRALQVLRHHRLWEVFLVECLKISPEEADPMADRMEHILPEGTAERLAAFLGNPSQSPKGHPIPQASSAEFPSPDKPLTQIHAGESGQVAGISSCSSTRAFLASQGILPGVRLGVLAAGQEGDLLVQVQEGHSIHLAQELADTITIRTEE
ncbi:MAG: metal-dependent transcriptional regulator [Omnitrophica WOR_2 bacterium]